MTAFPLNMAIVAREAESNNDAVAIGSARSGYWIIRLH
jgi:hypothetical protein